MSNLELRPFSDAEYFRDYYPVFFSGAAISRSRVVLEMLTSKEKTKKIDNVPLGGEVGAKTLLDFLESAKQGYFLTAKAAFVAQGFEMTAVRQEIKDLGIDWGDEDLNLADGPKNLTAYLTAIAIITNLSQRRLVCFEDLPKKIDNLNLGNAVNHTPSYWYRSLSPKTIWDSLNELSEQTQDILYSKTLIGNENILPVSHFFMTGLTLYPSKKS